MKGIYLVGGYPDRERFRDCFRAAARCGADFIEVGLPFNDPVADGPVIMDAIKQALESGITAGDIIKDVLSLRDVPVTKYIMTYAHIIYSFGPGKFSDALRGAVSGIIIPDLPNRSRGFFEELGLEIPVIPFATLETRREDLEYIRNSPADFVYFVGVRGTTGSSSDLSSGELAGKLSMIKEAADKKVIIGFGIKTKEDARRALELADGFVIGTEVVKRQGSPKELEAYLKDVLMP